MVLIRIWCLMVSDPVFGQCSSAQRFYRLSRGMGFEPKEFTWYGSSVVCDVLVTCEVVLRFDLVYGKWVLLRLSRCK
ncbi:hypothetical protein Droror1_Dr00026615, partial [Drosera rotundifolia]